MICRAFRLYLSSKAGKDAVLVRTNRMGEKLIRSQQQTDTTNCATYDASVFMTSLIMNVDPACKLLSYAFDENTPHPGEQRSFFLDYIEVIVCIL